MERDLVKINISGTIFEISQETFKKLLDLNSPAVEILNKQLIEKCESFFIERHPTMFMCVISFLQGRNLHLPEGMCVGEFTEELEYWGISKTSVSKCCLGKIVSFEDDENTLKILQTDQVTREVNRSELKKRGEGKKSWRRSQAIGWMILEEPSTSFLAKVYFYTSAVLVLASIFGLVCQTHPVFRRQLKESEWREYFGDEFYLYSGHFDGSFTSNTTLPPLPDKISTKMDFLYYIEYLTVVYFTIEIVVRFILYPFNLKYFFLDFLNWVDIVSLIVMYSIYFVNIANPKDKYEASIADIIHCMQIIRIFRLFRLVKNFSGFRVLMYAVKASAFEVFLMSMFLMVAMLMFGAFAFFSGDTAFPSIPDSFWWAVVTMTTVGYGDMYPTIALSKLVGGLCAITGVCLLAVIIPIFVNNFVMFYNYAKVWKTTSESKDKISSITKFNSSKLKIAPQS